MKKAASRAVYKAKQHAQSEYFRDINTNNDQNKIFKMARAIKDTNKDVTGEKCIPDDEGNLTISDEAKLHAWKEHYQRLLYVEFSWNMNSLNNSAAVRRTFCIRYREYCDRSHQEDETRKIRRTIRINN